MLRTEEVDYASQAMEGAEHRSVDVEHPQALDRLLLESAQRLSQVRSHGSEDWHSFHPS
jgi:hypothetical protein